MGMFREVIGGLIKLVLASFLIGVLLGVWLSSRPVVAEDGVPTSRPVSAEKASSGT